MPANSNVGALGGLLTSGLSNLAPATPVDTTTAQPQADPAASALTGVLAAANPLASVFNGLLSFTTGNATQLVPKEAERPKRDNTPLIIFGLMAIVLIIVIIVKK